MFLVVVLYLVFSLMTYINSALMSSSPYPLIVSTIRACGSGLIILGYMMIFHRTTLLSVRLSTQQWRWLIGYGLLIHMIAMCGFSYGALYASPVTICFLYASAPFITGLLQYLLGLELIRGQKLLGLVIGTIGLIPILVGVAQDSVQLADVSRQWLGNSIVIGAMIVFCYGWILFKKLLFSSQYPIQMLNGIAMLIGGIGSALAMLFMYQPWAQTISFSSDFGWLMGLFLVASLLTYSLYAYLLQTFSPTFISFAGFLEPVFGLFFGFLLYGFSILTEHIIAFLMLLLGLYVFYRQELQEQLKR